MIGDSHLNISDPRQVRVFLQPAFWLCLCPFSIVYSRHHVVLCDSEADHT